MSNLARAGLLTFQTVHGIVLGTELCIVAECGTASLLVGVAGGAAGLGLSLYLTSGGILGLLSGFAMSVMINGDSFDGPPFMAVGLAGTLVGLSAGTYFSRNWDVPSAPSVDLFLVPTGKGAMVGLEGRF